MNKLPLFVALDVNEEKKAMHIAELLSQYVLGFKIGPRLFFRHPSIVKKLSLYGEIFLDFKFFDIPSTMKASCIACFEMGAKYLTVHAASGEKSLSVVAEVEKQFSDCNVKILAVTQLTSDDHPSALKNVMSMAQVISKSGLTGLVASARELSFLRKQFPNFFIVTPGIRYQTIDGDDQTRTATPLSAIQDGSSALVMGRPIVESDHPLSVIQKIYQSFGKEMVQ